MLDGLPGRQQANAVEAPRAQARKMFVGFGNRERTADEGDLAMVGKVGREIGAAVRVGDFAIAAQIDAAQNDAARVLVDEPSSFNMQSREVHGARLT